MKICLRSLILLAVSASIAMPPARAWNSIGHMAVAYVAYQQMSPALRARALTLLEMNPDYNRWLSYIPAGTSDDDRNLYIFMMAATWPDEIKASGSGYESDPDVPPHTPEATNNTGYTDKYMHKYWHFVNTPLSADGTPLPANPTPNAQTQIAHSGRCWLTPMLAMSSNPTTLSGSCTSSATYTNLYTALLALLPTRIEEMAEATT